MTGREIFLLIVLVIGWVTAVAITFQSAHWKRKHHDAVDCWERDSNTKDDTIWHLQKQLEWYKSNDRVIKIEKFIEKPYRLSCKFRMHSEDIEHKETLKRVCIAQASRYLAEELSENDNLYRLIFERDGIDCSEEITMEFRLLPYPPGVSFEDYGRFDLRR